MANRLLTFSASDQINLKTNLGQSKVTTDVSVVWRLDKFVQEGRDGGKVSFYS